MAVSLCLKLGLSALILQHPENAFLPDSYGYQDLAVNLVNNSVFDVPGEPAVGLIRTPGYPVFVAAVYRLVGLVPGAVILVQLLLDAATVLLIGWTSKQVFGAGIGLLGAFIYALGLNATSSALYLLSDTLFTFLIMLALAALACYWNESKSRWLVASGLLLGIAALVRPIGLGLALIWTAALFGMFLFLRDRRVKSLQGLAGAALVFVLVVAPWVLRNYALTGRFTLSTFDAMNVYCCFAPAALAEDEHITYEQAQARVAEPYQLNLNKVNSAQMYEMSDYALGILLQHPFGYAKAFVKGILATLFEPVNRQWLQVLGLTYVPTGALSRLAALDFAGAFAGLADMIKTGMWLSIFIPLVNLAFTLVTYALAIIGVIHTWRSPNTTNAHAWVFIAAITVLFLVIAPGTGGSARFRVPAEPEIALLAGAGWMFRSRAALSKAK